MNILLLTPPYDLMKKGYGSKRKVRGGLFPPLGLAYLASPLIKDGHQVKIIDASSLELTNEEIWDELQKFKPDLIGLSSVTSSADESYSLAKYIKERDPALPIIYGGPHANCFPEMIFENIPELDLLIYGEGEITFKNVVDYYIDKKSMPQDMKGTWTKTADGLKKNDPEPGVADIDELLPPAYELFDYQKVYVPLPMQYQKLPAANMVTSRGCPYGQCTFCFEAGRASQKYRRHSPGRVIDEIKFLVNELGVKEVAFWDDNFLVNPKWVNDFCDLLDQNHIRIPWSVVARVNTVSRPMLERAVKSGMWNVFLGIESGNQDLLDRIKKGITLEQIRQTVRWCNELGIVTRGSFMLALPGETPEKARKTIQFACDIGVTYAQFLPTHPDWGTPLFDDAVASGRMTPLYQGRTSVTYVPDGYNSPEEIREMQKYAYHKFYFRFSYIWMHLKRLRSWGAIKQYYQGLMYVLGIS